MELRHLRYFVALAERLHFTAAAEQMHVTQPTLSHQIKQLENELGMELFNRAERRVSLTAAGVLFLPKVIDALKILDSGTALLKSSTGAATGHLRLATSQTFNISIVPCSVKMFREQHPEVRFTIEELTVNEMTLALRSGDIDMAIAYQPADCAGLEFEPLCVEELILVVRSDHAFADRKRVRMMELHRRDVVLLPERFMTRKILQDAFSTAGCEPRVTIESGTIPSLLALVHQTGLPTILSRNAVAPDSNLRIVNIENPRPLRNTGVLVRSDVPRTPLQAAFGAALRTVTENFVGR